MRDYGQILNFVLYLKNYLSLEDEGIPITEAASSRHDTLIIEKMFHLLKFNYEKIKNKRFNFRLVVCDMSWASIHATLFILNSETWFECMTKIYKISTDEEKIDFWTCSWLASCCAHTQHRFIYKFSFISMFHFYKLSFYILRFCNHLKKKSVWPSWVWTSSLLFFFIVKYSRLKSHGGNF